MLVLQGPREHLWVLDRDSIDEPVQVSGRLALTTCAANVMPISYTIAIQGINTIIRLNRRCYCSPFLKPIC